MKPGVEPYCLGLLFNGSTSTTTKPPRLQAVELLCKAFCLSQAEADARVRMQTKGIGCLLRKSLLHILQRLQQHNSLGLLASPAKDTVEEEAIDLWKPKA